LWVRELWVERQYPPEMQAIAAQFAFVQALPSDNPHLSAEYWDDLRSQPPDVQKAWVEGEWYVFKGQAFKVFRRERHIIAPQEIPAHWRRYRGIDWGKAAPFVCLWGALDPDSGRWIVYREIAESDLEDREQAKTIVDMTPPNERIIITYADPSIWTEKQKGVASTAVIYSQNGLPCTEASNARLDGKRRIDRLLVDLPDGRPGLLIFETCMYLVRTLPSLVYDRTQIEDVNTKGEDHAYDALRYLTTPASDRKPTTKPAAPNPIRTAFNGRR
jgi:phage terminase large subunit